MRSKTPFFTTMLLLITGLVALSACSSDGFFANSDQRATQHMSAMQTIAVAETQVGTITAWEATNEAVAPLSTQYADANIVRARLAATNTALESGEAIIPTVTPYLPPTSAPAPAAVTTASDERYVNTNMASGVREADGCATDAVDTFNITGPADTSRIYLTTIARNLQTNTALSVVWTNQSDGTSTESVTWTTERDYEQVCVYFWLESSDMQFADGQWTAELRENGQVVAEARFAMCEIGMVCGT